MTSDDVSRSRVNGPTGRSTRGRGVGRAAVALALGLSLGALDTTAADATVPPAPEPPGPAELLGDLPGGVGGDLGGARRDLLRGVVPVGPKRMFVGDFETGDFGQWGICQSALSNTSCRRVGRGDRTMSIVDAPGARQGRHAARFTVRPGDVPDFGGGERSEVQSNAPGALVREGDERWYEWSVRYPQDFPDPRGRYFIILQWHSASGSPPLAVDLSRGAVDIGGDGVRSAPRRTIGPIRRGEWVDYVLHVRFSRDRDRGFVEAWENGRRTVARTRRATMVDGENYLKQGIYRPSNSKSEATLTMDALRVTAP